MKLFDGTMEGKKSHASRFLIQATKSLWLTSQHPKSLWKIGHFANK